eukprot:Tamp_06956.p1 GENE.Tamp_06956~~Tamp_06956.p1  ORF type:complete len:857 (+),score=91.70 Tamp_06956:1-2571(+)
MPPRPWLAAVALSALLCVCDEAEAFQGVGCALQTGARLLAACPGTGVRRGAQSSGRGLGARRGPAAASALRATPSASHAGATQQRKWSTEDGRQEQGVGGGTGEEDAAPRAVPRRSVDVPGYRAPDHMRTWSDFSYQPPQERRNAAANRAARMRERSREEQVYDGVRIPDALNIKIPTLPPMKVVLIGGPCSGKGTIAPMLSQAFRTRVLGAGQLLRAEIRAGTPRGREASAVMERGDLLDDDFVVSLMSSRVRDSWDAKQNGFLLDGFPRSIGQAECICEEGTDACNALRPDCVIVLDRPDELVKEFALGRMTDSATGQTYHPVYAPPPPEVQARLVWRLDDTPEVVEKRCKDFRESVDAILKVFKRAGVPVKWVDNARSELETFEEAAEFLEDTARHKLREMGGWSAACNDMLCDLETVSAPLVDQDDVLPMCSLDEEGEGECLDRWEEDSSSSPWEEDSSSSPTQGYHDSSFATPQFSGVGKGSLLEAARRCNSFDLSDYLPVLVGDLQVGWTASYMLEALAPYLAKGHACECVRLQDPPNPATGKARRHGQDVRTSDLETHPAAIRLVPQEGTVAGRSAVLAAMVQELVADGVIPIQTVRHELREGIIFSKVLSIVPLYSIYTRTLTFENVLRHCCHELREVRPISSGFRGGPGSPPPLIRLERAAMIYFGVPTYGVHLNGFVRDPDTGRPAAVWIAKRSMSKATYPGLLDQMVAAGQPPDVGFTDNIVSVSETEAALPPELIKKIVPTGMVSYKYSTRKGLSTKMLATFDVEVPEGLSPLCADGSVEEYTLVPVEEAVTSIRTQLPLWKPNSALIMLDFAVRHGFIGPDEPDYIQLVHLLRGGLDRDLMRA